LGSDVQGILTVNSIASLLRVYLAMMPGLLGLVRNDKLVGVTPLLLIIKAPHFPI
jgi:hypothetical protein